MARRRSRRSNDYYDDTKYGMSVYKRNQFRKHIKTIMIVSFVSFFIGATYGWSPFIHLIENIGWQILHGISNVGYTLMSNFL